MPLWYQEVYLKGGSVEEILYEKGILFLFQKEVEEIASKIATGEISSAEFLLQELKKKLREVNPCEIPDNHPEVARLTTLLTRKRLLDK